MEALGIIAFILIGFGGFAYLVKNGRVVNYWMQTPHYNKEYKAKMLRREIEDAEEELERLKGDK